MVDSAKKYTHGHNCVRGFGDSGNLGMGPLLVMWYINAGVMMPPVEVVAHLMTGHRTNNQMYLVYSQFHGL